MIPLIFATNNAHKVAEIKSTLPSHFHIQSLKEAGIGIDIAEPFDTIEANAREKARVIHSLTRQNCFAEDTGLFIEALGGEPGVRSARYAGENKSDSANIELVLSKLSQIKTRDAYFKTVICAIMDGEYYFFEGKCEGLIALHQKGNMGFGYDPIFIPKGSEITFAEMEMNLKNEYSHRQKAMNRFIHFLEEKTNLKF